MLKIYVCTEDTIIENLAVSELEGQDLEDKIEQVIDELNEDSMVFKADGHFIMGQATAAYLKLEYGINAIEKEVE